MATKEKTPNYTEAQEQTLRKEYTAAPTRETVKRLAEMLGKNAASITAKLVRMEIYVKPEAKSKDGEPVQKKDEWADAIAKVIPSLTEAEIESLTKANKTALKKIRQTLANSKPIEPGDGNGE